MSIWQSTLQASTNKAEPCPDLLKVCLGNHSNLQCLQILEVGEYRYPIKEVHSVPNLLEDGRIFIGIADESVLESGCLLHHEVTCKTLNIKLFGSYLY